jgi:O-antigen/teichoic acid export membrane protein
VLVLLGLAVVVWAFCSNFLYGTLAPLRAAVTLKLVNAWLLLCALLGLGPLRSWLLNSPSAFVWTAALVVHVLGALFGIVSVATLPELRGWRWPRFYLPTGFWRVALYTHLAMLVEFCYWSLSPYFVLLWTDVRSLAYFHVATRFPLLLGTLPAMLTDVVAPGLSALEASGSRQEALRQAGSVIRAALLPMVPAALVFIFFAGDAMAIFNPAFRDQRDLLRIVAVSSAAAPVYHLGTGALAAWGPFAATCSRRPSTSWPQFLWR